MATITGTEEFKVDPTKQYVIAVVGYTDQTTHLNYFQNGGWIPLDNTTKSANWAERSLQPVTNRLQIEYDAGTAPLDVELTPHN